MNRRWMGAVAVGAAVFGLGGAVPTLAQTGGGESGVFTPLAPERILDTRTGNGVAAAGKLAAGATLNLQVAGRAGIPAEATGVVLNLTATEGTAPSFLTLFPTGAPQPNASSINFVAGDNIANMITVKLGTGGQVTVFNFAGDVHVLADVAGYYVAGDFVAKQDLLRFRVRTSDDALLGASPGIAIAPENVTGDAFAQVLLGRPNAGCVFSATANLLPHNATADTDPDPYNATRVFIYWSPGTETVDVIAYC